MRALRILIFVAVTICIALAIGVGAREWMWRMEHGALDSGSALSPSGKYLAEARMLSEGDVVPYGQGVFVRNPHTPFSSASTLVFAGYCRPEIRAQWRSAKELVVECVVSEGTSKLLSPPDDMVVTHDGDGS